MEKKLECKKCYVENFGAAAGQGFTKYTCKKCGQTIWHHNTNTPEYCTACCEKFYICQRCGKDLLLEAVLEHKEKHNLYDAALEIGCSESTLWNYINKGILKDRTRKKIIAWYEGKNER